MDREASRERRDRWTYTVVAVSIWAVWIINFHRSRHFDEVGFVLGVFTLAAAVTTWWLRLRSFHSAGDSNG